MEKQLVFGLFLLCSMSGLILAQNSTCDPSNLEHCLGDMKQLYSNAEGPIIVKNEKELQTLCRHQQTALTCISNFVNKCLTDVHQTLYNNLTHGVREFISDFCMDNSQTRKIYLKHLSCFNKVADKVHHCSMRLNEWQKSSKPTDAHDRESRDTYFKDTCCQFGYAMTCMKSVVQDGCPEEAYDIFSTMVNKITYEFTRVAQCDAQSLKGTDCNSASWNQLSIGLLLASLVLALSRRS